MLDLSIPLNHNIEKDEYLEMIKNIERKYPFIDVGFGEDVLLLGKVYATVNYDDEELYLSGSFGGYDHLLFILKAFADELEISEYYDPQEGDTLKFSDTDTRKFEDVIKEIEYKSYKSGYCGIYRIEFGKTIDKESILELLDQLNKILAKGTLSLDKYNHRHIEYSGDSDYENFGILINDQNTKAIAKRPVSEDGAFDTLIEELKSKYNMSITPLSTS